MLDIKTCNRILGKKKKNKTTKKLHKKPQKTKPKTSQEAFSIVSHLCNVSVMGRLLSKNSLRGTQKDKVVRVLDAKAIEVTNIGSNTVGKSSCFFSSK